MKEDGAREQMMLEKLIITPDAEQEPGGLFRVSYIFKANDGHSDIVIEGCLTLILSNTAYRSWGLPVRAVRYFRWSANTALEV